MYKHKKNIVRNKININIFIGVILKMKNFNYYLEMIFSNLHEKQTS
jgi:hypothetical protein